jgi:hypothetical protein
VGTLVVTHWSYSNTINVTKDTILGNQLMLYYNCNNSDLYASNNSLVQLNVTNISQDQYIGFSSPYEWNVSFFDQKDSIVYTEIETDTSINYNISSIYTGHKQ